MRNRKFGAHNQIIIVVAILLACFIRNSRGNKIIETDAVTFVTTEKSYESVFFNDSSTNTDAMDSLKSSKNNVTNTRTWGFFSLRPTSLQTLNSETAPLADDLDSLTTFESHPCRRVCNGQRMNCYYRLALHNYQRFGSQCKRCQYDPSACEAEKCIYGDGIRSGIMAVNYKSPGPAMELCENDAVVVDVLNYLSEPTTMHWHGLHMSQTPDMDGGPYITQYPIQPGEVFRYSFIAERSGTNWYHSHVGWQRALGIAGAFIIRQTNAANRQSYLYDYDLVEHTMIIQDIVYNYNLERPTNILINGKGRNHISALPDNDDKHRYERINVTPGYRYRMRVISNGVFNCPIEFSIENHRLLIIATDGNDIEPILADSFFMASAERFDFVLEAKQYANNYWIRVRGYNNCSDNNLYQGAVLHYRGVKRSLMPNLQLSETENLRSEPNDLKTEYVVVNYVRELENITRADQFSTTNVATSALKALEPLPWPAYTKFLTYYTSFGLKVARDGSLRFQIDDITYTSPTVSLLQGRHLVREDNYYCNKTSLLAAGRNCQYDYCQCTNVIRIPAYRPIELVVTNLMETTHPFHTHGFTYRLVGQGVIGSTYDLRKIVELDRRGVLKRLPPNFPAPEKDTIQIPALGYIIVRFLSNNPGYWMFHCHIEQHAVQGMVAIMKVGENNEIKSYPPKMCC